MLASAPPSRPNSRGLIFAATSWGLFWGGWAGLLPEVKDQIGATDSEFGLALFGIPFGALPAMVITGKLVSRMRERALPVVLLAFAAACALPGWTHSPVTFALSLVLIGATSGAIEVALNATTAEHEARDGVRLFNKVHAATPLAMVVAAPSVGLARQAGASSREVLLVIAALVLVSAFLSIDRAGWRTRSTSDSPVRTRSATPILIAFGLVAAVVLFMENAVEQWGAIHLEQDLGAGPLLGSAAPAAYMIGLAGGRLLVQWQGERFSGLTVVVFGSVLGAVGLVLAVITEPAGLPAAVALAGFALAGIGLAPAVPTLLGMAGKSADDERRPAAITTVTTISYLGFLGSPPLVGLLAATWGLTTAFAVVAAGGVLVAAATALLRVPEPEGVAR
ncbi:MFS transporter [Umezawaea sp. Da 62-37]|uniref:MFS transporter n=1 Tax=Umezawaea sp. Da 62-37 TaxID=3075927 RepID=UPI0037DDD5EC